MQYIVPKFIERESKIVGPLTFKQFIIIAITGGICLFLFFSVPFSVFIMISIILGGISLSLAFLKVDGISLPTILGHFLTFSVSPKIYIWRKKDIAPPKIIPKKELEKININQKPVSTPRIVVNSKLKNLSSKIESR